MRAVAPAAIALVVGSAVSAVYFYFQQGFGQCFFSFAVATYSNGNDDNGANSSNSRSNWSSCWVRCLSFLSFCSKSLVAGSLFAIVTYSKGIDDDYDNSSSSSSNKSGCWVCSMLVAESLFADVTYRNGKDDDVGNSSRSDADQEIKAKDHKNDELLTD